MVGVGGSGVGVAFVFLEVRDSGWWFVGVILRLWVFERGF